MMGLQRVVVLLHGGALLSDAHHEPPWVTLFGLDLRKPEHEPDSKPEMGSATLGNAGVTDDRLALDPVSARMRCVGVM